MEGPPPLRQQPTAPDNRDQDRVRLVRERWDGQSGVLLPYHRQIEEQVRMIAGRHWEVWSEPMRRYVDVMQYMSEQEKFWLQRPTFNLLVYWFQITHARLTESPPSPIFQPATSDRLDRELADCLTPVFRTLWGETQMEEAFVRATAWLVIAGSVYIESSADFSRSAQQAPQQAVAESGAPDPAVFDGGTAFDDEMTEPQPMDDTASGDEYEGNLVPRVRNPLEVRAEWGADIPWERKRWIITRSYLTLEEARSLYGVDIAPTPDVDGSSSILQRLLFSSGYYDSSSTTLGGMLFGSDIGGGRQVAIDTMWEAPSELSPETDESPGGRLLIVAGSQVLHDSPRPYRTKCAGPIRRANFLELAGRGGFGTTPLESMIPVQKAYNRGWAQILQHRNLSTNPIKVIDSNAGIADDMPTLPGGQIEADFSVSPQPVYYLTPPPLSSDVWRTQQSLLDLMRMLGSTAGAEGAPQTEDPSGELVSQLRFNSDRPVAVAARSLAQCIAGMAEDWVAILPTIWPNERTLEYAGEDEMFRNVTLTSDLWEGSVNVRPDLENARLETPESKEQRAMAKFQIGLFGPPGTPEAAAKFAEYARTAKLEGLVDPPSSVDSDMARYLMSSIAQGQPFDPSILQEWYDYGTWTRVLREHMASPEFLKHEPTTAQQFKMLWAYIQTAQIAQQQTAMQRQAPLMAEQAATQGSIARIAQLHGPQDPNADPSQPSKSGDSPSPDAKAA